MNSKPSLVGGAGSVPTFVAGGITVMVAGLALVPPASVLFLSKPTVYGPLGFSCYFSLPSSQLAIAKIINAASAMPKTFFI